MTDQDNLRARLSDVIDRALYAWPTVDDALDGTVEGAEEDFVAQAIIDELGLTNEWSFRFEGKDSRYPLNRAEDLRTIGLYGPLEDAAIESRIVGKWERQ